MFIAHFEIEKEEPKKIYFRASKTRTAFLKFEAEEKKPVKFKIDKNFKIDVN